MISPVFFAYLATFATSFAWPTIAPPAGDRACPSQAGDWIRLVLAVFGVAVAHSFHCLWLVERTISRAAASGEPIGSLGSAIARNGSLAGWATYFGFRIAAPGALVLLALAVETACAPEYHQLLAIALATDATLTALAHGGTWSRDALERASDSTKKVE